MNILDYIKGPKRGKPAHEFEEKLMRDPFLAEAMEGYEKVKGNHNLIIARLQKQVSKKAKRKKFRLPMFIWSTIATAVAVVAFIAFFFLGGFHLHFGAKKQLAASSQRAGNNKKSADTLSVAASTSLAYDTIGSVPEPEHKAEAIDRKLIAKDTHGNNPVIQRKSLLKRQNTELETPPKAEEKEQSRNNIKSANAPDMPLAKTNNPEAMDVIGTVKDSKGSPLAGVKVSADNGTEVFTDSSGKFTLRNVLKGQTISFSYIGFKSDEMVVSEKTNLPVSVTLNENNDLLSEQVIISKDQWKAANSKRTEQKAMPAIGYKAYLNYLQKNKMPAASSDCKNKRGKVKVAFSTDEKGRPYNIRILQKLCPEYDGQAISLINKGPAWTPSCENVEYEVEF
jgi:outer membrane biosynthesis protein TonB